MRCPQCGQKDCCGADMDPEIERLTAELAECISALKKIANPIDAMQRELPDGARLNGAMATALANDPNYLRDVAKTILQNLAARKGEGE